MIRRLCKKFKCTETTSKMQRQLAIRIIAGYRTVSYEVATLLARTPPWILVARKYKRIYDKIKRLKEDRAWNKDEEDDIKEEEERDMLKQWKNRTKKDLPGPKVRKAVVKRFEDWTRNKHGGVNYHLTQLLTGYGCFNSYLQRIEKVDSAMCTYCKRFVDNAEHTLMVCEKWDVERDAIKLALNSEIDMENLVKAICSGKETWKAVNTFAQCVIGKKRG